MSAPVIRKASDPQLGPVRPKGVTLTDATVDSLGNAIREGLYQHGSQLPPEKELMVMLGVSRTTLREALQTLEDLGYITRHRGLGTFVSEKSINRDLSANFGITEMIRQAGMEPGHKSVSLRHETANASLSSNSYFPEGSHLLVVDRVRTANKRVAVWSLDYIAEELMDEATIKEYMAHDYSLYQFLHDRMKLSITRGEAQLYPIAATAIMASKLHIRRGVPLMRITQTDFLSSNEPILYSMEYHLPDLFLFTVHRKGPHW
jgi:GntR family transcriptional regulator